MRGRRNEPGYMPNRRLTDVERQTLFAPLLEKARAMLRDAAQEDVDLYWALRRKLSKELGYDERGKPMDRKKLKKRKRAAQDGRCAACMAPLPERGAVLDRHEAMGGHTAENTQLLCPTRDVAKQERLKYA